MEHYQIIPLSIKFTANQSAFIFTFQLSQMATARLNSSCGQLHCNSSRGAAVHQGIYLNCQSQLGNKDLQKAPFISDKMNFCSDLVSGKASSVVSRSRSAAAVSCLCQKLKDDSLVPEYPQPQKRKFNLSFLEWIISVSDRGCMNVKLRVFAVPE